MAQPYPKAQPTPARTPSRPKTPSFVTPSSEGSQSSRSQQLRSASQAFSPVHGVAQKRAQDTAQAISSLAKARGLPMEAAKKLLVKTAEQIGTRDRIMREAKRQGLSSSRTHALLSGAGIPKALFTKTKNTFVTPGGTTETTTMPGSPSRTKTLPARPKSFPHPSPMRTPVQRF